MERIRKRISVAWNDILKHSGALVMLNPNFTNVFNGTIWKTWRDIPSDDVRLVFNFPTNVNGIYYELVHQKTVLTGDIKELIGSFNLYMKTIEEMKSRAEESLKNTRAIRDENDKNIINFNSYMERLGIPKNKHIDIQNILKKNNLNIQQALDLNNFLIEMINDALTIYPQLIKNMNDEKYVNSMIKIAESAKRKKIDSATKIVWQYEKGQKIKNYNDYFRMIEDDNRNAQISNEGEKPLEAPMYFHPIKTIPVPYDDGFIGEMQTSPEEPLQTAIKSKSANPNRPARPQEIPEEPEQPPMLNEIAEQPEQPEVTIIHNDRSEVYKVNTYYYQPIRNNNLVFKKGVKLSEDVEISATCNLLDLNLIAIGNLNGSVYLLETKNYTILENKFTNHTGKVTSLTYLHDGESFISTGEDGHVHIYRVSNLCTELLFSLDTNILSSSYALDGQTLFVATNSIVAAINIFNKNIEFTFSKGNTEIMAMNFIVFNNKSTLLISTSDSFLNIYDGKTRLLEGEIKLSNMIKDIESFILNDELYLGLIEYGFGYSRVWYYNVEKKTMLRHQEFNFLAKKICYLHDNKTFGMISDKDYFLLINVENDNIKKNHTRGYEFTTILYLGYDNTIMLSCADGFLDFFHCK